VSKQSAQDHYVTKITLTCISCSDRHASPGNWKRSGPRASNSRPVGPKAATLTTTRPRNQPQCTAHEVVVGAYVVLEQAAKVIWRRPHRMCGGNPDPRLTLFLKSPRVFPKQNLDPLSRFCTAKPRDRQSNRRPRSSSVAIVRSSYIRGGLTVHSQPLYHCCMLASTNSARTGSL